MNTELEKVIEDKRIKDKKLRRISFIIMLVFLGIVVLIFCLIYFKNQENEQLVNTTVKNDSTLKQLQSKIINLSENIGKDTIECTAKPLNQSMQNGDPLYIFTLKLNDSILANQLYKVDYYFNHPTFNPKIKSSIDRLSNFSISYHGWGCLESISVFLHYQHSSKVDTIKFPMCDKTKFILPKQ